jgi:hypothetical protein
MNVLKNQSTCDVRENFSHQGDRRLVLVDAGCPQLRSYLCRCPCSGLSSKEAKLQYIAEVERQISTFGSA